MEWGGRAYKPELLAETWVRVGRPLGIGKAATSCEDVCRSTCDISVEPVRSYRIRGIKPEVAVSSGGSSRDIFVRLGLCETPYEARLIHCLRKHSR